jgi:hypothetical protein
VGLLLLLLLLLLLQSVRATRGSRRGGAPRRSSWRTLGRCGGRCPACASRSGWSCSTPTCSSRSTPPLRARRRAFSTPSIGTRRARSPAPTSSRSCRTRRAPTWGSRLCYWMRCWWVGGWGVHARCVRSLRVRVSHLCSQGALVTAAPGRWDAEEFLVWAFAMCVRTPPRLADVAFSVLASSASGCVTESGEPVRAGGGGFPETAGPRDLICRTRPLPPRRAVTPPESL